MQVGVAVGATPRAMCDAPRGDAQTAHTGCAGPGAQLPDQHPNPRPAWAWAIQLDGTRAQGASPSTRCTHRGESAVSISHGHGPRDATIQRPVAAGAPSIPHTTPTAAGGRTGCMQRNESWKYECAQLPFLPGTRRCGGDESWSLRGPGACPRIQGPTPAGRVRVRTLWAPLLPPDGKPCPAPPPLSPHFPSVLSSL